MLGVPYRGTVGPNGCRSSTEKTWVLQALAAKGQELEEPGKAGQRSAMQARPDAGAAGVVKPHGPLCARRVRRAVMRSRSQSVNWVRWRPITWYHLARWKGTPAAAMVWGVALSTMWVLALEAIGCSWSMRATLPPQRASTCCPADARSGGNATRDRRTELQWRCILADPVPPPLLQEPGGVWRALSRHSRTESVGQAGNTSILFFKASHRKGLKNPAPGRGSWATNGRSP